MIDILDQIIGVIGVFVILLMILFLCYFVTKRIGKLSTIQQQSKYMKMLDRMAVGQDKSLCIVLIGETYHLIGISAQGINMLKEFSQEELTELEVPSASFEEVLKFMKKNKDTKRDRS